MADRITLTLPDDIQAEVQRIADIQAESIEDVLIERLRTAILPLSMQNELNALHYLSDDALKTIAKEQVSDDIQERANHLLQLNNSGKITEPEYVELIQMNVRADELMLRKAEASSILRKRGYNFSQADFLPDISFHPPNLT